MQQRRVIINTDAKNEADDQFAIVHGLLSPSLDVRGLIPAHFGTRRTDQSLQESRDEVDLLLRLLKMESGVTVANGAETSMPDETTPVDSPGARLIISEALASTDNDPLFIAFLGPLTDMASAILLEPEIVKRSVTVIWIGGLPYGDLDVPYTPEFNLSNDVASANVVFDSGITVWQVPSSTYVRVSTSYAELEDRIGDSGELGRYLIDQLVTFNEEHHSTPIESRSLGDSPAISLMLFPAGAVSRTVPAPRFSAEGGYLPGSKHPVRLIEDVDVRFLMEDMFAKIRRFDSARR